MEPVKLTYDQLVVEYQSKLSEIMDQLLFKNAENKELVKIIEQQEQEITTRNNMINDLNNKINELTNKLNELRTVNDTEEEIAENYKEHIHKRGV